MTCTHHLGHLPCDNPDPHPGHGDGCTHTAAWLGDHHDCTEATEEA